MADEGRRMSLASALRGLVDKHVKQRPRDTIVRNAMEDPAKPLAQRVTEEDACEFCVGEADGRPVSPARASRHFHRFCKCHYLLFFQETRYQGRIVDDNALRSVGVDMEEGADPDWYERRNALTLAAAGHRVKFLKRHRSGPRRADTLLDGELVEFKNPTGGGRRTVQNQILKNLYGENKTIIKPQSDVLLISNVRSPMTMSEMEESLAFAFGPESCLTAKEKACVRKIILLDERTGRIRAYEMKKPVTGSTLGNGHRQIHSIASKAPGQAVAGAHFHTSDVDPVGRVLGPAKVSHPRRVAEIEKEAAKRKVRIRYDSEKTIAYAPLPPDFNDGFRGEIVMTAEASIAALEHEWQHVLTDEASGWAGLENMLSYEAEWAFEREGYRAEIEVARSFGLIEEEKELRAIMEKARQEIWMKHNYGDYWAKHKGSNQ